MLILSLLLLSKNLLAVVECSHTDLFVDMGIYSALDPVDIVINTVTEFTCTELDTPDNGGTKVNLYGYLSAGSAAPAGDVAVREMTSAALPTTPLLYDVTHKNVQWNTTNGTWTKFRLTNNNPVTEPEDITITIPANQHNVSPGNYSDLLEVTLVF